MTTDLFAKDRQEVGTVASGMMPTVHVDVASRAGGRTTTSGPSSPRDDYYAERGAGSRHLGGPRSCGARPVRRARGRRARRAPRRARSGERRACWPARRAGAGGNVAFDLTFAAPKSVSVLAAVGDEPVRRGGARRARRWASTPPSTTWSATPASCAAGATASRCFAAEGFVGAIYVHEMARSGDPHLHAHLVIANRVRGPDGRWSAPDMRPVYAEAKTAGTIADAVMRAELTPLARRRVGAGRATASPSSPRVPASVREHFSAAPRRDRRGGARARAHLARRDRRHPARDARPKARRSRARRRSPAGARAPPSTASARASCAAHSGAARPVIAPRLHRAPASAGRAHARTRRA